MLLQQPEETDANLMFDSGERHWTENVGVENTDKLFMKPVKLILKFLW